MVNRTVEALLNAPVISEASERVGNQEFIELRWQDIDMDNRTININHGLVRVKRHRGDLAKRLGVPLPKTQRVFVSFL